MPSYTIHIQVTEETEGGVLEIAQEVYDAYVGDAPGDFNVYVTEVINENLHNVLDWQPSDA
jgi:hypothetical protein